MTTLTATVEYPEGAGWGMPRVKLVASGLPTGPAPVYASDFTATDDGWSGTTGAFVLNGTENGGAPDDCAELQGTVPGATVYPSSFNRSVSGLTVGVEYRFRLKVHQVRGQFRIGVSGIGYTAYMVPGQGNAAPSPDGFYMVEYIFTATATSHVIQVVLRQSPGTTLNPVYWVRDVTVAGTAWAGTRFARTDTAGSVALRDGIFLNNVSENTVWDYEHALHGTVTYGVTDGLGGVAYAYVNVEADNAVYLTLPTTAGPAAGADPTHARAEVVTDYRADLATTGSIHQVIGRTTPIANPGPLTSREGTFEVWCRDHDAANQVRTLLAGGLVAHLRQPTFAAGFDLYFVARSVSIAPAAATSEARRWAVTVAYTEVERP